jgi:hypothetical protein
MELVREIIENLTDGTTNNDIEWKLSNNLFNSETQKYFETFSVDGKTKFVTQVYLDDKFNFQPNRVNFFIYNKDLVNGSKIFASYDYKEIEKLGESIYNKYIKPNTPQKNENDTYKSILSNIFTKQHKRDQRIDAILGDETKLKSILNKLFGN